MGRFDEKYPAEVKAELCRLVLDAKPRRTVPQAVAEVAKTQGVEIHESSAYSYVKRERMRRSGGGDSPLPEDPHEALDLIARKQIVALHAESQRIIRAGRHGRKPLDAKGLSIVARTIKELRAGLEPRGQSKSPDRDEPEGEAQTSNGDHSSVVADLLAAHDAARADTGRRAEPGPSKSERDRDQGDAILSNGGTPRVDRDAQAQIQAYIDRKAERAAQP